MTRAQAIWRSMSRARAVWLAVGAVVLTAVGLLLLRRARRPRPLPAPVPVTVPRAVDAVPPTAAATEELRVGEPVAATPADAGAGSVAEHGETPLPAWARAAIVAAALMAFLLVSLLATKQI